MTDSTKTGEKEMSFLGHLEELRWRLVRSTIAILIVAVFIFIYTEPIVDQVFLAMKRPDFPTYRFFCWMSDFLGLSDALCATEIPINTQSTTPTGQFSTNMYFAFIGGFIIAFPFVFYQFWSFLKPALKDTEYSVTKGAIFWASLLFFLGIAFGYFLVSPLCVQFFGNYKMHAETSNNFTISSYLSLITTTTLFSGLFFELPMIIMIFSKLGVISSAWLKKYRKHALIIILVVSAIITPPDVISQILVSIPILILYEIGIIIAKRNEKQTKLNKV
jgi:sec-independent protein translocase protein TatC